MPTLSMSGNHQMVSMPVLRMVIMILIIFVELNNNEWSDKTNLIFFLGSIEEQDWVKVIKTTFDITLDQLARKRAFDTTLSNTLKVGGFYQVS